MKTIKRLDFKKKKTLRLCESPLKCQWTTRGLQFML